jgi:hypothetical protein
LAAQPAAPRPATGPDSVDPRDTVPFLASDALGGRGVGTAGLDTAALFISGEFRSIGLEPLPSLGGYYQPLMMTTATALGPNTTLDLGDGKSYVAREDFIPASFSRPGAFSGPVVFVGYGVSAGKEYVYDDYDGVDVGGKVALAMRFEPHDASGKSRFKPDTWSEMATLGRKALTAAQHGAAALVLVTPWEYHGFDSLMTFNTHLMEGRATIPVIQVTRPVAEALLKRGEVKDLKSLQELIDTTGQPHSAELNNVSVSGNIDMKPTVMPVKNIVGVLPGVGPHADEYVVVGAHYDHLGTGRYGGTLGPRGAIYHGADDNASGTGPAEQDRGDDQHGHGGPAEERKSFDRRDGDGGGIRRDDRGGDRGQPDAPDQHRRGGIGAERSYVVRAEACAGAVFVYRASCRLPPADGHGGQDQL